MSRDPENCPAELIRWSKSLVTVVRPWKRKMLQQNNNLLDGNENYQASYWAAVVWNCSNWQDEDAHKSGVLQRFVVHWRFDYILIILFVLHENTLWFVCLLDIANFLPSSHCCVHTKHFRKIMSVCCSVGLVNIIFLFLLLFVSLLIRENGSVLHSHLISQRETSHFLFHSSESATAGQTLGCHLGLIFGFSSWRLKA